MRLILYPYSIANQNSFEYTAKTLNGSNLKGNISDIHFYSFCINGYYDFRNVAIASALVSPGGSIIEVGANVGTETVYYSEVVDQKGTVFAFEPFPPNLQRLLDLQKQSKNNNIQLFDVALSNKNMNCNFVVPEKTASGTGHIKQKMECASQTIKVDVMKLDSLIEKVGKANLIAIDIEGEEINFLDGAKKYIEKFKPYLIIEACSLHQKRSSSSLKKLYKKLISSDYKVYQINRFNISEIDNKFSKKTKNWLCVFDEDRKLINKINRKILFSTIFPVIGRLNPLSKI